MYSITNTLRTLTSTLQASAANAALRYHCCCAAIFAPNSDKKFHSHYTNIFWSIQTCVTGAVSIIQQNMC